MRRRTLRVLNVGGAVFLLALRVLGQELRPGPGFISTNVSSIGLGHAEVHMGRHGFTSPSSTGVVVWVLVNVSPTGRVELVRAANTNAYQLDIGDVTSLIPERIWEDAIITDCELRISRRSQCELLVQWRAKDGKVDMSEWAGGWWSGRHQAGVMCQVRVAVDNGRTMLIMGLSSRRKEREEQEAFVQCLQCGRFGKALSNRWDAQGRLLIDASGEILR